VDYRWIAPEQSEYRQQRDDYCDHNDPQKNPLSRRELLHIPYLQGFPRRFETILGHIAAVAF
jgi:hypothetical protein